jgi:hypothetical protein
MKIHHPEQAIVQAAVAKLPALDLDALYSLSADLSVVRETTEEIVRLSGRDHAYRQLQAVRSLTDDDALLTVIADAAFLLGVEFARRGGND